MPEFPEHVLAPLVRKLGLREELDDGDRAAILNLPFTRRKLDAGQYLAWDGDRPQNSCLLLSGFAFRHKHAGSGGRQILSFHMKGDLVDLQKLAELTGEVLRMVLGVAEIGRASCRERVYHPV